MYVTHNTQTRMIAIYDEHAYSNDGENWFPSVTNILGIINKGAHLLKWYQSNGFNADYLIREAQELGKLVHGMTEKYDSQPDTPINQRTYDASGNVTYEYPLKAWDMLSKYVDFVTKNNPEFIAVEQALCSPSLGVGGTVDRIFMLNGERWLADVKTGENIYREYSLQCHAYKKLWEEAFPAYPIDRLGIIHLNTDIRTVGKKGDVQGIGWKLRSITEDPEILEQAWTSAHNVWKWANENWRPYFKQYPDHFQKLSL
jgi:hypothetical protein